MHFSVHFSASTATGSAFAFIQNSKRLEFRNYCSDYSDTCHYQADIKYVSYLLTLMMVFDVVSTPTSAGFVHVCAM